MRIDYSAAGQVSQLKNLWLRAFGDGEEFLNSFFETAYAPERCRCITIEDRVAAMLFWFDTECAGQRFAYLYAVSTDPDFQNRGLCRKLMADTEALLKEQGYHGVLLYPASEGLSRMYGKMGYGRCTAVREFTCEAGDPIPMRQLSPVEYARLRRRLLPDGGVIQEGAMLDFLATQADFYAGDGWVAAVSIYEGKLHCQELLGNCGAAPGIVAALGKSDGFFRTAGSGKPFAMVKKLDEGCKIPAYFGLPLD